MWKVIHTEYGEVGYGPAIVFYFVCIVALLAFGNFVVIPTAKSLTAHQAGTAVSHNAN
jgi:hypothetical protein